jgi:hypothetical protein
VLQRLDGNLDGLEAPFLQPGEELTLSLVKGLA